ncbi:MAG: hypothetical protein E7260_09160 [Lachnospiraceae bacterium]|nr:hypothetical protein [Lachnospiraceae bacterium]
MVREEIIKFFNTVPEGMYIRTLPPGKWYHGYFDNTDDLADSLESLDDEVTLYYNAHSISDDFKDTIPINTLGAGKSNGALKNADVSQMQYLIVDIDVDTDDKGSTENVKVNVTKEENDKAVAIAQMMAKQLGADGFTGIGIVNSGNGAHVMIPCKPFVVKDNINYVKQFVRLMRGQYNQDNYKVDTKVTNAGRIFKMPGTLSKKGTSTDENPWRHASIVKLPEFDKANDFKAVVDYVNNNTYSQELYYVDSNGKGSWNLDLICEKALEVFHPFRDQYDKLYTSVSDIISRQVYNLEQEAVKSVIREWLKKSTDKRYIADAAMLAALQSLTDEARNNPMVELHHRMVKTENGFLYDLGDNETTVSITPGNVELADYPEKTFITDNSDKVQVLPDLTADPKKLQELMKPFFNLRSPKDWILLMTFIAVAFIAGVSHPILFLEGEKGSAKSTICRWIQSLVNPKVTGLYRFPDNAKDLSVILGREFALCFDNLGGIRKEMADILCQAVTGGYVVERKLFTNDETVTRGLKTILILNGLNLLSNKEDLLDRVLIITLERFQSNERISEKELEAKFDVVKPQILGGFLNAVAVALTTDINPIKEKIRLLDYQEFAVKCGLAMGFSQDEIENAFVENTNIITETVIENNPITEYIVGMMYGKTTFDIAVSVLHEKLCEKYGKHPGVPKSSSAVSRKLSNFASDLAQHGITYTKSANGKNKILTFVNNGTTANIVLPKSGVVGSVQEEKAVIEKRSKPRSIKEVFPDEEEQEEAKDTPAGETNPSASKAKPTVADKENIDKEACANSVETPGVSNTQEDTGKNGTPGNEQ